MGKLIITATGDIDNHTYVIFNKKREFFEIFSNILLEVSKLEPLRTRYSFSSEETILDKDIKAYVDVYERINIGKAKLELSYGKNKVFLSINAPLNLRNKIMKSIQNHSNFKTKIKKPKFWDVPIISE